MRQLRILPNQIRGRSQTMFTKFVFFWPPAPLRLHFLWNKNLQKVDFLTTYPSPLVNVLCERPPIGTSRDRSERTQIKIHSLIGFIFFLQNVHRKKGGRLISTFYCARKLRSRGVGTRGAKGQLPYQYFWIIVVKTPFCPTNIPGF